MALVVPSGSRKHEPLPTSSLPPSPTPEEEDLSLNASAAWHDDDTEHRESLVSDHRKWKGKGKERAREPSSDVDDEEGEFHNGALTPVMEEGAGYPPVTEDEEEERRVMQV